MHSVFDALTTLRPFDIDVNKIRVGPRGDGGYILADILTADQTVLSYGIADQFGFDTDLATAGHQVFMFDPTVDISAESLRDNMRFLKEGCAGVSDGKTMFSIVDHLERNNISGDRLILKMDVEGAEYDSICAIPDEVLTRFEQLVMEVHFLAHLGSADFRKRFCRFMTKINRIFTLFHVHANNFDGADNFTIIEGLPTPNLIELSFVKSSVINRFTSRTLYPTFLDSPNSSPRDKLLWFYPYYPTNVDTDSFGSAWTRNMRI